MAAELSIPQPDLGYVFYPAEHHDALGHPRLDVVLRPEPTGRFFETYSLRVSTVDEKGLETILLSHLWIYEAKIQNSPGTRHHPR